MIKRLFVCARAYAFTLMNMYLIQVRGVCVDPAARCERLQVIQEKIDARDRLLARPQRLSASRPLSRREMEIERALFRGSDRQGFLTALYHQGVYVLTLSLKCFGFNLIPILFSHNFCLFIHDFWMIMSSLRILWLLDFPMSVKSSVYTI